MKKQEPDFDAWKTRFDMRLREDRHAARSRKRLSDAELDMDVASYFLWLACDFDGSPGYEFTSSWGSILKEQARKTKRLAKRLSDDLKEIEVVCGSGTQSELQAKLKELIDELRADEKKLRSSSSKRSFNPSFFLAALIRSVREKTSGRTTQGNRPLQRPPHVRNEGDGGDG